MSPAPQGILKAFGYVVNGCFLFGGMMKHLKRLIAYFTVWERILWCASVALLTISFIAFEESDPITFAASLIGVTALIFCAKGNPFGQALMIVFCLVYGAISYGVAYYGEMITYLGMSCPMAILALVAWLRNPFSENRSEVRVNRMRGREILFMGFLVTAVTVAFFFVLKYFNTANLYPATLSVATSFAAVYLTFRRSPYFALLYSVNDIVLLVLWSLAAMEDFSYISVIVCFVVFLANDLYGFFNWLRMEKRQNAVEKTGTSS